MPATELREGDARQMGRRVGQFGLVLITAFVAGCILAETVVVDFALPAIFLIAYRIRNRSVGAAKVAAAFVGAYCLGLLAAGLALLNYSLFGRWPPRRFPHVGTISGAVAAAFAFILAAWGATIIW